MPPKQKKPKQPPKAEQPFPWLCHHCGKQEVVMATTEYTAEVRHDGRLYTFVIPDLELPVCQACGERVFTEKVDAQVNDGLRAHLILLTPAQIRDGIKRVGMSQRDFAVRLGIAEATLSRWLNETQIQSRAMDNYLRIFIGLPQVRNALCGVDTSVPSSTTLKQSFPGDFRPTDNELRDMWKSALFVLDANVLLDLYRYSPDTREKLLEVFSSVEQRLWIPHQVAKEFSRHRVRVILEQADIVERFKTRLQELGHNIREELSKVTNRRPHPIISIEDIAKAFEEVVFKNLQQLEKSAEHMISDDTQDHVLARIESLLESRVGPSFSDEEHAVAVKEGEQRFKEQMPPGFRDACKDGDDKYGDWFLWKQVLAKAAQMNCHVIFVTDDGKGDWWWKSHGQTLGPRPELVAEMQRIANVKFYLYRTERFLWFANEYLDSRVEEKAIDEVREVQGSTLQAEDRWIAAVLEEQRRMEAMTRPILEAQQAILQPILERQRQYEAMMHPILEEQRRIEEMTRPILEARQAILQPMERYEAMMRPALDEMRRHEALVRPILAEQKLLADEATKASNLLSNLIGE
ncbi:MAG: PIN domain-containing protein [Planctomycetota bacterium]